jgi:hypothetical protein
MSVETIPTYDNYPSAKDQDIWPDSIVESNAYLCELLDKYPFAGKLLDNISKHHENTQIHSYRVALIATELCKRIDISGHAKHLTVLSALLHDTGKLKVDPNLLSSGELTVHQRQNIRDTHTNAGPEIVREKISTTRLDNTKRDLLSDQDIKALQFIINNHHNKDANNIQDQLTELFADEKYRKVVSLALCITIVADITESCLPIGIHSTHGYKDRTGKPEEVVNEIVPYILNDTRFCDLPAEFKLQDVLLQIINDYVTMYKGLEIKAPISMLVGELNQEQGAQIPNKTRNRRFGNFLIGRLPKNKA